MEYFSLEGGIDYHSSFYTFECDCKKAAEQSFKKMFDNCKDYHAFTFYDTVFEKHKSYTYSFYELNEWVESKRIDKKK